VAAAERGAVLVAGGAGFIGSHVCKALAAEGYMPVTIDNLTTGYADAVRWGPLHVGDIADRVLVGDLLDRYPVVGAMHFAAFSQVGESMREPVKYFMNNVAAATQFASALMDGGVEALVFSSTAAVYGEPVTPKILEHHPLKPINPYGASKLAFEMFLHGAGAATGLRYACLRYFNAAGADEAGEIGESHEPETHLIPLVCKAVLGTGPALTLFGEDYDTPDGTAVRDYVHVADLADAHLLALERLISGGASGTWNIGVGNGYSVRQVVETAAQVLQKPVPHVMGPRRPGDPPSLVANGDAIRRDLGWRPKRDLADMIRSAAAWQQARPY